MIIPRPILRLGQRPLAEGLPQGFDFVQHGELVEPDSAPRALERPHRLCPWGFIITLLFVIIGLTIWAGALQAAQVPAKTLPAKTLNDLAGEAAIICTCQVVEQQSQWDTEQSALVTLVTLHVEEYLKGTGGTELVVRALSGMVGDKGSKVTGAPVFEQGERAVLFLKLAGETAPANTRYNVVGEAQGKFTIRTDPTSGEERIERNLSEVRSTTPGAPDAAHEFRTLAQLKSAIRAATHPDGGGSPTP